MSRYTWVLLDADGRELRSTDNFESKETAEEWLGAYWRDLLDEGAASVSLRADDEEVYEMGLTEG